MDNIDVVKYTTLTVEKKPLVLVFTHLGSISLQTRNFIEIKFRDECSPVNFLHIFRTPFS